MATIFFSQNILLYNLNFSRNTRSIEKTMTNTLEVTINQLRSHAYGLLAASMDYPDQELQSLISSGQLAEKYKETLCAIHPKLEEEIDWRQLGVNDSEEDLQVEYTRLFDAGAAGPLCPIHGGVYLDERMQTLEEMVRFYNHFGLTAGEDFEELPDHITTQLEFMHFLCNGEDELQGEKEEVGSYQRAQRDFLNRHLGKWIPQLEEQAIENKAQPFYLTLVSLLARFIKAEQDTANDKLGYIAVN